MPFVQPEISNQQIEEARAAFLKELESRGDAAIHPNDLEKVKKDDFYVKRFLMHHDGNQKLALEMIWEALQWRKEFGANDINESNLKMDILVEGIFFSHGRDKDGHPLFIFKCKKHSKGKNMDEIKRIIVYWMERLERQEKGNMVSLFFDMDNCGVSNMDLDLVKYLITLFKQYYPYFLNYIIVFEMQWILNAAFKIIKSWLPEKAIERLRVIKKPELSQYVDPDQALKCWGGNDDYIFSFVPETPENIFSNTANRKVHFADGSPVSEAPLGELNDTGMLSVTPASVITFVKEGNELVSTLELQNTDTTTNISYKMKTTSPEKFKVRPSAGSLAPGARVTIHVTLLQGFQLGGLSRDKFLVMSMPVDSLDLSPQDLAELWKNASGKNISQHRLRCVQANETAKNGSAVLVTHGGDDQNQFTKISARLSEISDCQSELHRALKRTQLLQWLTIIVILIVGLYVAYSVPNDGDGFCYKAEEDVGHMD